MKAKELPSGYHIENFSTLLNTVFHQYSDLLSESEVALHQRFTECSYQAKSLYVRLLTRKGPLFRVDKLNYPDIKDTAEALNELNLHGLVAFNPQVEASALFKLLTKSELLQLISSKSEPDSVNRQQQRRKTELIGELTAGDSDEQLNAIVQSLYPYVKPGYTEDFETYRICFFGNDRQDLTEFVITDLGHLKYETYPLNKSIRYFTNRKQIENQLAYSGLRQRLDDKAIANDANLLFSLAAGLPEPHQHPALNRRYQNLVNTIARQLERLDSPELALTLYRQSHQHPSQERQARILKKLSDYEGSLKVCAQLMHSAHPEEREFALRFIPTLEKQSGNGLPSLLKQTGIKAANNSINQADLTIPKNDLSVELNTAMILSNVGQECYYVENTLFCGLFGLLFWDIIFTPVQGAFINAFQRGPLDLFSEFFYRDRKELLDKRLDQLDSLQWQSTIVHFFETKKGIANYFVYWDAFSEHLLKRCFQAIPPQHLRFIFQQMLQHPGLFSSGFPDLICFYRTDYSEPGYELIEVKAPGDKLQANQKRWFQFFAQHQIPAKVLWISWQDHD